MYFFCSLVTIHVYMTFEDIHVLLPQVEVGGGGGGGGGIFSWLRVLFQWLCCVKCLANRSQCCKKFSSVQGIFSPQELSVRICLMPACVRLFQFPWPCGILMVFAESLVSLVFCSVPGIHWLCVILPLLCFRWIEILVSMGFFLLSWRKGSSNVWVNF